MVWRARCLASLAALYMSSCGFIGIDLIDLSAGLQDGAADAQVSGADDGGFADEAGTTGDASTIGDASDPRDAGGSSDASGTRDGSGVVGGGADGSASDGAVVTPGDASATDAQVVPACSAGFANCDATPLTCETQLGTISNCASCGDVCPANGGTARCNGGSCATVCDATGTYAMKMTIVVTWPTGIVNGGSGTSVLWSRFTGTQSGNNLVGTLQPCGFTLPDFSLNPLVANELYQLTLPNTLFDHVPVYIPAVPMTISSPSGFVLGAPFSMPAIAFQVGANLSNPASDPWPPVTTLPTIDMDADGKAGVTGSYTSGAGYTFPRANMTGTTRSDRAYTAARFALSSSGSGTSCSELNGSVNFSSFDTHIVSCRISGGSDCTPMQRDTVDSGRPLFAPTSATLRALKIAAGATCASVRAALP